MTEPMRKEYASLRRRPFLTPVWLTALGGLLAVAVLAWAVLSASTTTVYVIEAEAVADGSKDPPLTASGQARAQQLRDVFGHGGSGLGIDGVVIFDLRGSQETARPLADARGIPVVVVDAGGPAEAANRAIHEFRGGRVLIIGHADTVPAIVEALSGQTVPAVDDAPGFTVYVVARPRYSPASVSVLHLP